MCIGGDTGAVKLTGLAPYCDRRCVGTIETIQDTLVLLPS